MTTEAVGVDLELLLMQRREAELARDEDRFWDIHDTVAHFVAAEVTAGRMKLTEAVRAYAGGYTNSKSFVVIAECPPCVDLDIERDKDKGIWMNDTRMGQVCGGCFRKNVDSTGYRQLFDFTAGRSTAYICPHVDDYGKVKVKA